MQNSDDEENYGERDVLLTPVKRKQGHEDQSGDFEECLDVKEKADSLMSAQTMAEEPKVELDKTETTSENTSDCCGRCLQFLIPFMSVIGGSLIGPIANSLPPAKLPGEKGSKAFLLQSWRFGPLSVIVMVLLPLYYCFKKPATEVLDEREKISTIKLVAITLAVDCLNVVIAGSIVWLSFFTVMSHMYLLTNLHGALTLVVSMVCFGLRTHWAEKLGLLMLIIGASIMVLDPSATKVGMPVNITADLLCLLVNIPFALFFVGNSFLKKHISMPVLITQAVLANFIISSLIALKFENVHLDMSDNGIFGWLR